MIRVSVFEADGGSRSGGEELLSAEPRAGGWIWIDLEGSDERFEGWLRERGFHHLAIEDTFTLQHQPRVEIYEETLFVIVRGIDFNTADDLVDGEIRTLKLAAFLDSEQLVTYHRAPLRSLNAVRGRIGSAVGAHFASGSETLWSICDEMMEHYVPLVDATGDRIEVLEEAVLSNPRQEQMEQVLALRRRLLALRKNMQPHRQVFGHLAQHRSPSLTDAASLGFRDVQDNVIRLADLIEQQRDQLTSVKDTYLSVVAQKTNEVMKVLTVFSAIVLPLSLVAGIYGMNFAHMPELATSWGYPVVLGSMAAIAGGMLAWFRRKGWL